MAAAIAGMLLAVAVIIAAAFVIHILKPCLNDLNESIHILIGRGDEFFGILFLVDDYLHDINAGLAVAFLVLIAFAVVVRIDEHGIFLAVIVKIVDNIEIKIVAVIIGECDEISFFAIAHGIISPLFIRN